MRAVLVAVGSRGDVAPMAALGHRLAARGHEVVLVTHTALMPAGPWRGIPVASDPTDLLTGPAASAVRRLDLRAMARTRGEFAEFLAAAAPATEAALREPADVVVASTFANAAVSVARRRGVPVIRVHLWPEASRPDGISALVPYSWALPGPARTALRRGVRWSEPLLAGFDGEWQDGRLHLDIHHEAGFTTSDLGSLHAYSPLVGEVPDEPGAVGTGWWAPPSGGLSERTAALLDTPGPWVHVGFGSMPQRDGEHVVEVVERVARSLGIRAAVQLPGAPPRPADAACQVVGEEPHAALLARVRASVHHGGSGTVGAATTAGVPQVVVPHLGDQHYWAHRLRVLRVAAAPLPRPLLDERRLRRRLVYALQDATAARARALGTRTRDGAEQAAVVVEERVAQA